MRQKRQKVPPPVTNNFVFIKSKLEDITDLLKQLRA